MFKNLILASATAVLALTASASFSDDAAARTAQTTQTLQLKQTPTDPGPGRTPKANPVLPKGPASLAPNPYVDLYGEPYYPATYEGLPGHYYCMFLAGNDKVSRAVQVKVRNKGTKVAGPVQVTFQFFGGQQAQQTMNMSSLAASYIFEALIPASAWHNNSASFTIRIDYPNQVAESNEANNTISSFCMGPEG
jgi:hypothetical protein